MQQKEVILEVLKWLRCANLPGGVSKDFSSEKSGDLYKERCAWDERTCSAAAKGGHLELLKWLRDPDLPGGPCPWDSLTCAEAAGGGHLKS